MKNFLARAPIALAILATSGAAAAADATASFRVTSFEVSASGGTLSWVDGGAFQNLFVQSAEAGGLADIQLDGRTGDSLADASVTTQVAHASAGVTGAADGRIAGSVSATPFAVDAVAQPHSGESRASQSHVFTLSQAGTVTFSVDYRLDADAPGGDDFYTYGYASLGFDAGAYGNTSGGSGFDEAFSSIAGGRSGRFTFTVAIDQAGDHGWFDLRGNAFASAIAAPVPEPSEWALMAAGLGLLGVWRARAQRREEAAR